MLFTLLAELLRSFLDKPGSFLDKSDLSRKDQKDSASPEEERIVSHDAPCFMLYYHCVRDIS